MSYIAAEGLFMMFAGTDNSAFMAANLMRCLCRSPEWLKQLQEEQDVVRADVGDAIGKDVRPRSTTRPPLVDCAQCPNAVRIANVQLQQ